MVKNTFKYQIYVKKTIMDTTTFRFLTAEDLEFEILLLYLVSCIASFVERVSDPHPDICLMSDSLRGSRNINNIYVHIIIVSISEYK